MESNQSPILENDVTFEVIKVRCPSCYKLFGVETAEIFESKPQFQCARCSTQFWFSYPVQVGQDEILGFPVEWLESPTAAQGPVSAPVAQEVLSAQSFHCPRCEAPYATGDKECPKCGVVFAKLDFVEDAPSVPASPSLKKMWRQVMDNYTSPAIHEKFVQLANRERNLLFASHQYARLLKAHSGDEVAIQRQKEIVALTEVQSGVTAGLAASQRRYLPRVSTLVLLGGGVMIGVGFVVPALRNLIGLGVAAVFFTLAADWLVKRAP